MTDSRNELAAIDTAVSSGRFVIASDNGGNISPAASSLLPFIPVPYLTSRTAGWDNSLLTSKNLRFAPRAGLAWNLPGKQGTVLRAGFGVYPNQAAYSIITNFSQNLPFFALKTVNTASTDLTPTLFRPNVLTSNALGSGGRSRS
jgi:hypothetical protein